MTPAERKADVRFWRTLARDYERRTAWVCCGDDSCACWPAGVKYRDRRRQQLKLLYSGDEGGFGWPQIGPLTWDERATACALLAAMVEAGDAP
jgi:hypothetical protein